MNMPQSSWSGTAADFVRHILGEHPEFDYNAVKDRASAHGLTVPPIVYGRVRKEIPPPAAGVIAAGAHMTAADDARSEVSERDLPDDDLPDAEPPHAEGPDGDDEASGDEDLAPAPTEAAATPAPLPFKTSKSPALDYAMRELTRRPDATYQELKAHCDQNGWRLPPILYGRAKALLGQVPVKPRTTKRQREAAAASSAPAPALRLRQVESVDAAAFSAKLDNIRNLDQLVATVREIDAERRRLRDLLEKVVEMIDEALG